MIPHALFRNTVIPLFMLAYLVNRYTKYSLDEVFKWLTFATVSAIPLYTICTLFGVNVVTLVLESTWRSILSPIQYLIYIWLVNRRLFQNTGDSSYSYTLSVVSAGVVGYLYEVPRWVLRDGLSGLFRTARTSFLVVDFGLLAVPFMFFMLRGRRVDVGACFLVSLSLYVFYVLYYAPLVAWYLGVGYSLVHLPLTVGCRVPAFLVTYFYVSGVEETKPITLKYSVK